MEEIFFWFWSTGLLMAKKSKFLSFIYNGSRVYLQKIIGYGNCLAVTYNKDRATPADSLDSTYLFKINNKLIANSNQRVLLEETE